MSLCAHKFVLGSEVDFGKAIAATVNASVDGDVEKFKSWLLGSPHPVPTQLAAIDGHASASGNDWAAFIGKEQVNTRLRAPADCRIRQAHGTARPSSRCYVIQ